VIDIIIAEQRRIWARLSIAAAAMLCSPSASLCSPPSSLGSTWSQCSWAALDDAFKQGVEVPEQAPVHVGQASTPPGFMFNAWHRMSVSPRPAQDGQAGATRCADSAAASTPTDQHRLAADQDREDASPPPPSAERAAEHGTAADGQAAAAAAAVPPPPAPAPAGGGTSAPAPPSTPFALVSPIPPPSPHIDAAAKHAPEQIGVCGGCVGPRRRLARAPFMRSAGSSQFVRVDLTDGEQRACVDYIMSHAHMKKDLAAKCMSVSKTTLKKVQLALGMGEWQAFNVAVVQGAVGRVAGVVCKAPGDNLQCPAWNYTRGPAPRQQAMTKLLLADVDELHARASGASPMEGPCRPGQYYALAGSFVDCKCEEPGASAPAEAAASPATSPQSATQGIPVPPSPPPTTTAAEVATCEPVADVEADEPAAKRRRSGGDAVSMPPVPTRGDLQFEPGCLPHLTARACSALACP
jgi:hypothetical protein